MVPQDVFLLLIPEAQAATAHLPSRGMWRTLRPGYTSLALLDSPVPIMSKSQTSSDLAFSIHNFEHEIDPTVPDETADNCQCA